MDKRRLTKPDGRALLLYARHQLEGDYCAQSPSPTPLTPNGHLRWHPLRGEWVTYAGHRQQRTFLPSASANPLAASCDPAKPTEVPDGNWDVAVFENLFPAFSGQNVDQPDLDVPTAPATGVCEVVVFTQDPGASLGALPHSHVRLILDVWADRYAELGRRDDVRYVFPFENRGREVGVTLPHPHGQIYGYPFIPPIPARELEMQRTYLRDHGRGLLEDLIAREVEAGRRIVYRGDRVAAFTPVCARYAYEMWVAPYRAAGSIAELDAAEREDFAAALKTVLLKLDGLWQQPMPYILVLHQQPTDGADYPEAHVHAEIYPALRMRDRLKFLAGSEVGAGVFTADMLPEESARQLQAIEVDVHA